MAVTGRTRTETPEAAPVEDVVFAVRSPGQGGEELAVACLSAAARELPAQACWELASILIALVQERSADPAVSRRAECLTALRLVAERVGDPPSVRVYDQQRQLLADEGVELPGSRVVVRVFRTWLNALRAAGCPPTDRHGRPRDAGVYDPAVPRYEAGDVVRALRACAADLGRVPTVKSYAAWREARLRALAAKRPQPHLPQQCTIRRFYGSWPGALSAAGLDPQSRKVPARFTTPTPPGTPQPVGVEA